MMSEYDSKRLMKLIENRPAIYNNKLDEYKNRSYVRQMWEEIGNEMGLPAGECRWKWGNLRKSYTRFIKDGYAARGGKCWLSEHMEFLDEFISPYVMNQTHVPVAEDLLSASASNTLNDHEPVKNKSIPFWSSFITPSPVAEQIWTMPSPVQDQVLTMTPPVQNHVLSMPIPSNVQNKISTKPSSVGEKAYRCEEVVERQADTTNTEHSKDRALNNSLKPKPETQNTESEHPIIKFIESILSDVQKLSEKRKRKFKQDVLISLNNLIDKQEMEKSVNESISKKTKVYN